MHHREQVKAERERGIFEEFCFQAGLRVSRIEPRKPPEADILCSVSGAPRYFEIAHAASEQWQEIVAGRNIKVGASGPLILDVCQDLCRVLNSKLEKGYQTLGAARIDLLLYVELREPKLLERLSKSTGLREAVTQGSFTRIWIYQRAYGVIGIVDREPFRILFDWRDRDFDFRSVVISDPRYSVGLLPL